MALALLAALLLPNGRHPHREWVTVTVQNGGTVSADVHAEAGYWPAPGEEDRLELQVPPEQSASFRFRFEDLERLRVRIHRSSDDAKIFDETWEREELEDLERQVTITIAP
jgi:hypothetical protein